MQTALSGLRPVPSFAEYAQETVSFQLHEWQQTHLCPILERLKKEKGLRLLIHGPPQYGKSVLTSQRLPAWLIGCDPNIRIGLAAYNETHAAGFGQVVKDQLLSDSHREIFPSPLGFIGKDAPQARFMTQARKARGDAQPSFLAMGLNSGFTGKGVDLLIVDDPYKDADEARSAAVNERVWRWWTQTASVRLGDDTNVVVMFHRYHDDDFAGRLLATGKFEYVRFPAVADGGKYDPTGRELGELLSPMRSQEWIDWQRDQDEKTFLGQFQGLPRPDEGAFFNRDDFQYVEANEVPPITRWFRGWDLALTTKQSSDFTAGSLIGVDRDQSIYIKDQVHFKGEFPDVRQLILDTAKRDGVNVPLGIEKPFAGIAAVQDLLRNQEALKFSIWPIPVKGDKKARAQVWAARGRAKKLYLVRGDWNEAFINQCLAFTGDGTTKDDRIDSVSVAMELLAYLAGGTKKDERTPQAGSEEYYRRLKAALGR